MKKYLAEGIGTAMLVILGCGTAMLVGCDSSDGSAYILTALAFGLAIVCIAYSVGKISGGHVNPAVSFGMLMSGRMSMGDFIGYVIAQVAGGVAGSAILAVIFGLGGLGDLSGACGANSLENVSGNVLAGLLVEIILTFIFVLVILSVTASGSRTGVLNGLIIGLTLTAVHILGIGLTGTSVNPARSFGPALFAAFSGTFAPLISLWVFIVGPMAGAALAAICSNALTAPEPRSSGRSASRDSGRSVSRGSSSRSRR